MDCRNKVYVLHSEVYQLVMETDLCIEDILEAIKPHYRNYKVLITDDSGKTLFKTR